MVAEKVNDTHWMVLTMTDFLNAIKSGELDLSEYDLSFYKSDIAIGAQPVPPVMLEEIRKYTPFERGTIYGITGGGVEEHFIALMKTLRITRAQSGNLPSMWKPA